MKKKLTALFLAFALTASTLLPAAAEIFPDGIATPETAEASFAEEPAPEDLEMPSEAFSPDTESTDPSAVVQAASIFDGGSGTESDPYLISTADQLRAINDYLDCSFKLCADIDMADEGNWVPINSFCGSLDGAKHTISGLNIVPDGFTLLGLFGDLPNSSVIKNVTLSNLCIISTSRSVSSLYIGGISARGGHIENCAVDGTISVDDPYVNIGGITSSSTDSIENCTSNISVNIENCSNFTVSGISARATIKNCLANVSIDVSGAAAPSPTSNNYAYVGGISAYTSTIEHCIATGSITINNTDEIYVGGIAGQRSYVNDCTNLASIRVTGNRVYCGGICGDTSSILMSSNHGNLSTSGVQVYCGGIIGIFRELSNTSSFPLGIQQVVNYGNITSDSAVSHSRGCVIRSGGIIGYIYTSFSYVLPRQAINYGDIELTADESSSYYYKLIAAGIAGNVEASVSAQATIAETSTRKDSFSSVDNCYNISKTIYVSANQRESFEYREYASRIGLSSNSHPTGDYYSLATTSCSTYSGTGVCNDGNSLTANQLLQESTFTNFNFVSTWRISPAAGGPVLQSDPYAPDDSTPTPTPSPEPTPTPVPSPNPSPSPSPNPGDDIDFDVNIYRANQMLDPDNYSYAGYIVDDLARDTPSQIYKDALADNAAFATNIAVWKGTTGAIDLVDSGPAKTAEMMIERKDMYTALIIASFQANTGKSVLEGYAADAKKVSDTSKKIIDDLSKANNRYATQPLNKLSNEEQSDFLHELGTALCADSDNKWGKLLKNGSELMKNCSSVLEFTEMMCDSIYLVDLAEGQKDLLDALLDADPQDPDLRLAIEECKEIANSSYEEACATTILRFSGKKDFEDTLDTYWGFYKDIMNKVCPEAKALLEIMKSGKTFCDAIFGTSSTIESYYKIYAILNLEALATSAYWKLENQYANNKTAKNAELYLGMVDLMYGIWSVDCDQARGFVDSLDPFLVKLVAGGFSIINEDFVNSSDTGKRKKVKAQIDNLKQIYQQKRETINMVWVEYLEEDYPGSGLYEYYEPIASKPLQDRVKKIKVSCPVNVSVTDAAGTEVAAIRDGCLTASGNVAVTLDGDSKIFTFYDDADYSISIEGYDAGTMDVTASVYGENDTRTITYVDVPVSDSSVHHINELTQDGSCNLTGNQDALVPKQWDSGTPEAFTTYTVDVTNGVAGNGGTPCHTITAVPGQTITVSAQMLDDQTLIHWQATGCTLSDTSAETVTFVMPAQNVALTAVLTDSAQVPDPADYTVTSSSYTIEDAYITGVEPRTICSVMLPQLTSKSLLYLTDTDGMILDEDATVCTGSTATNAKTVLTVVVAGDVNGDGTVSSSDLFQMCRAMMRVDKLDGAALKAATPASQQKNQPASSDLYRTCRYLMKLTNSMYHD